MIQNARALRPNYTPRDLHHRDGAIDHLTSALEPVSHGFPGEDVLITGRSGVGKTTLARYTVEQLERETLDVRSGYVNCLSDSSKAGVLHTLLRDSGLGRDLRRDGTATGTYLDRLRDGDDQFVFILDEVDALADRSLLVTLYEQPNVTMLLVCVDQDNLLADAGPRVESRIRTSENVRLEKYRDSELADIIGARAEVGLRPGSIDDSGIKKIAELAGGDARFAIALLRQAARRAERDGYPTLTAEHIEAATDDAEVDLHERNIEQLSTHTRLLFEIIREHGSISASELHDEYERRAQTPKAKSTRRRYLGSLERYALIRQRGQTRATTYEYREP